MLERGTVHSSNFPRVWSALSRIWTPFDFLFFQKECKKKSGGESDAWENSHSTEDSTLKQFFCSFSSGKKLFQSIAIKMAELSQWSVSPDERICWRRSWGTPPPPHRTMKEDHGCPNQKPICEEGQYRCRGPLRGSTWLFELVTFKAFCRLYRPEWNVKFCIQIVL